MFKLNEVFSNHHIFENGKHVGWIDVHNLMFTLRSLKKIDYQEKYSIENVKLKDDEFKPDTLEYFEKYGAPNKPVVITTENFCLDGRHRIHYNRLKGNQYMKAYVIPHELIDSFIKKTV
jgi:hypothetical protein